MRYLESSESPSQTCSHDLKYSIGKTEFCDSTMVKQVWLFHGCMWSQVQVAHCGIWPFETGEGRS